MQWILPDTNVQLVYRRDGAVQQPVTLTPVSDNDSFWPERGFLALTQTRIRKAAGWGDAMRLGARETRERFVEVLRVLGQLLTFRMSMSSGPAKVAERPAS